MFNVYNRYTDTAGNLHFTDCYEKHGREHIIRADGGAGMSECVVRMEMPNGCHDCKLRNMVGNCPIPMFDGQDEKKFWTLTECFQRPPWCPIICQLPEGHGRLVNAIQSNNGFSGENITDEINKKYEDYMARQKELEKTMLQERLGDMRHMSQELENQVKGDAKDDDQLPKLRSSD